MDIREAIIQAATVHRPANWSSIFCSNYDTCKWANREMLSVERLRIAFAEHVADEAMKLLEEVPNDQPDVP